MRDCAGLLTLLSSSLLLGCGDREAPGTYTVDTAPSGIIAVNNVGSGTWDESSTWRLIELHRVGSLDDDSLSLDRVWAMAVDSRDHLYVLQPRVPRVLHYDASGRFVRSIGRAGEGPGEFRFPDAIALDRHDRLWVWDSGTRRITVFDSSGAVSGTIIRQTGQKRFGCRCAGILPDGEVVEGYTTALAPSVIARIMGPIGESGSFTDSLVLPLDREPRPSTTLLPVELFEPRRYSAPALDGAVWTAFSDSMAIVQLAWTGDTVRIVTRALGREPLSEDRIASARRGPGMPDVVGVPQDPDGEAHRFAPLLTSLAVDGTGHLWVSRPEGDAGRVAVFDVFTPEGVYLGGVTPPTALSADPMDVPPMDFTPLLVTSHRLYGIRTHDSGIQQVVVLGIRKPTD